MENKSVLDGVEVQDKAFPLKDKVEQADKMLTVVGQCPSCGAAIYGKRIIQPDEQPVSKYSCNCWRKEGVRAGMNVQEK